jgi:hypothetical protein
VAEAVTVPRKRGMWQRMLEFDSRHPLLWNLFPIFLFVTGGCLGLIGIAAADLEVRHPAAQAVAIVLFMVPTIWRRRYPFAVLLSQFAPLAITIPLGLTDEGSGLVNAASALAFTVVLFNLVLRRPLKLLWWAGAISLAVALVDWLVNHGH